MDDTGVPIPDTECIICTEPCTVLKVATHRPLGAHIETQWWYKFPLTVRFSNGIESDFCYNCYLDLQGAEKMRERLAAAQTLRSILMQQPITNIDFYSPTVQLNIIGRWIDEPSES